MREFIKTFDVTLNWLFVGYVIGQLLRILLLGGL